MFSGELFLNVFFLSFSQYAVSEISHIDSLRHCSRYDDQNYLLISSHNSMK